jgi:hypothetical protein
MKKERKIELTGRSVSLREADDLDIEYWLNKSIEERLTETERLRRMIWSFRLGRYPDKMEKTGKTVSKKEHFSNDF